MNISRLGAWMVWSLLAALACTRSPIGLEGTDTGSSGSGGEDGSESDGPGASGSDTAGDESTDGPASACGDGFVDPGEVCDDGDSIDGNGCNVDCRPSGELEWIAELPAGADGGFYPHVAVVGDDDAVTVAGMDTGAAALFVARWDAAGTQRWIVTLDHAPDAVPSVGGIVVRADGSVRVVSRETTQSFVHHLEADGSAADVTSIGSPGGSVSTLVAAPANGWWAVGRHENGRVFAELHDGDDELVHTADTDLVAVPRDAAAIADGIVVLADSDQSAWPQLLSVSGDGRVEGVTATTCGGGLALTSAGLRVVGSPRWDGGEGDAPCVLTADGEPASSPWSEPLVDGAIHLAVGPSDRLVVLGWRPEDAISIQSQLADGGAAWSSEHATGDPYLLPFGVAVGASGRIAVPAVSTDRTGAGSAVVFVFAP